MNGMRISSLPKGCIYEVNFVYHSKMGGYTTLMSDIPKLYEIPNPHFKEGNFIYLLSALMLWR